MRWITACTPLLARIRGITCSSSMRRSSRGTPGVKKKRARPMSSAKPHAVPIGLSITSAVVGSMACFRLLGGMMRLRRLEEVLHPGEPLLVQRELDPCRLRRDLLRQVVHRRPEAAVDDDRIRPLSGELEGQQQALAIVADRRLPLHREPDVLELLAHVAEVRVDDLAGQHLVARADDLDAHGPPFRKSPQPIRSAAGVSRPMVWIWSRVIPSASSAATNIWRPSAGVGGVNSPARPGSARPGGRGRRGAGPERAASPTGHGRAARRERRERARWHSSHTGGSASGSSVEHHTPGRVGLAAGAVAAMV